MRLTTRFLGAMCALLLLVWLVGCGGGGTKSSLPANTASFTLDWPARGRTIPTSADRLILTLFQGADPVGSPATIDRPAGDKAVTTQYRVSNLPAGILTYLLTAEAKDAEGVYHATGTAQGTVDMTSGKGVRVPIAVTSPIRRLEITSTSGIFEVEKGHVLQLIATAYDAEAGGNVVFVPVNNLTWTYPDPAGERNLVINDAHSGMILGQYVGYGELTLTERDTGLTARQVMRVTEPINTGALIFHIDWPTRSRALPAATNSLEVRLMQGVALLKSTVVNYQAGSTEVPCYFLPLNAELRYTITAYPQVNKVGVPLGTLSGKVTFLRPDTQTIDINANMLTTIKTFELAVANSDYFEVLPGTDLTLLLIGRDSAGRAVPIDPTDVSWTSDQSAVATVSNTGVVHGVSLGTANITVQLKANPAISATATVKVKAQLVTVAISPTTLTVNQNASAPFTARVTGTTNTAVTWSVQEANAGIITPGGVYTAPSTAGTYHVVATSVADPDKSAVAVVTVRKIYPPTARFTVLPTTGDTDTLFRVDASGSSDIEDVASSLRVHWKWTAAQTAWEPATATTTKTASHTYTTPGTYIISLQVVDSDGMTGTTSQTVTVTAVGVKITPNPATVFVGETQQFSATPSTVTWSVEEGSAGGTITAGGLYTAPQTPGTYHLTAVNTVDPTMVAGHATVQVPAPALNFTDNLDNPLTALFTEIGQSVPFKVKVVNSNRTATVSVVETVNAGTVSAGAAAGSYTYVAPTTVSAVTIRATLDTSRARRGRQAAATTFTGTLPVKVARITRLTSAITSLAYSPHKVGTDYLLARGLDDGRVMVDLSNLAAHTKAVLSVAFNPPNAAGNVFLLASAGEDMTVRLWDPKTLAQKTLPTVVGGNTWHTKAINCVALGLTPGAASDQDLMLATASDDLTIKLWHVDFTATAKAPMTLTGEHTSGIKAIAFSPDGRYLASGGADGRIVIWNVLTGVKTIGWSAASSTIKTLAFSPNGAYLASGGSTGTLKIWSTQAGTLIREITNQTASSAHDGAINSLAWVQAEPAGYVGPTHDRENKWLITGSNDARENAVKLWNISTNTLITKYGGTANNKFVGHTQSVYAVAYKPDAYARIVDPTGNTFDQYEAFASGDSSGQLIVWP